MESLSKLISELPADYQEDCFKYGAIKRARGVSCPEDLMKIAMFHLHNATSLLEASETAKRTKLGELSDVALMKRLEQCNDWFKVINGKLVTQALVEYQKPSWMEEYDVLAVDASNVLTIGSCKKLYKFHYLMNIFGMNHVQHVITDHKVGEKLSNFEFNPKHLIFGDRIYTTINGIEHCENCGAKFVLRMKKNSFTIRDESGNPIDLVQAVNNAGDAAAVDINGFVTTQSGKKIAVRVCARRKDSKGIEDTRKRLKRLESKKQLNISTETKVFNEYIVVVTNLDESVSADEVLEAYRLRWQIEIYFKRLKTILDIGNLPKRREKGAMAWLNGKLMIALLIEIVIAKHSSSLMNVTDRSIWRETQLLSLWLKTGFCDEKVFFGEFAETQMNLCVEKRRKRKSLQLQC